MTVRAFSTALLLAAVGLPCWSLSPQASRPVQGQDGLGASGPMVAVRELHLVNVSRATVEEQEQIANSLVGVRFPGNNTTELAERLRDAFQRHGFFEVRVASLELDGLDRNSNPPTVSVTATIDEGDRYYLKEVRFTGNKAVSDLAALRNLIPLKDGDIFNVQAIRKGIKNLRDAYGQMGFINFTPVPETVADEKYKTVTLTFDLDEGAQFFIKSFTVRDTDEQSGASLQAAWLEVFPPGSIYNAKLVEAFFAHQRALLPPGATPERNLLIKQDAHEHTLDIVLLGDRK